MIPAQPNSGKNVLVIILSVVGCLSLAIPLRIISAKVSEVAERKFAQSSEREPLSPEWKATMAELKTFVESSRGLKFKRDFPIVLESQEAFHDRLAGESEEYYEDTDPEEEYVALKALGLVDSKLDLKASEDPLRDAGTLGYYDFYTGRMVVGADKNTPFVRSVLVHELTHALQDQNFNLDPDLDYYDESYLAFEALVEGDARRVENAYLASLSPEERALAEAEEKEFYPEENVDPSVRVLGMLAGFSYEVGEEFVNALFEGGAQARVDRAFRMPPTTTEQVLHPERFVSKQRTAQVAHPKADGNVIDEGVWGERGLLTLFLNRLEREQALAAADGWDGDYYVAWRKGGRDCVRMNIATDGKADQDELLMALRSWAHGRQFTSVTAGKTIDLKACA